MIHAQYWHYITRPQCLLEKLIVTYPTQKLSNTPPSDKPECCLSAALSRTRVKPLYTVTTFPLSPILILFHRL